MPENIVSSDHVTLDVLAGIVAKHWRSGGYVLDEAEARALDRLPIIDHLRRKVVKNDADWLLSQVESGSDAVAGLACSLLKNHIAEPKVKRQFESRWASGSPYLKMRLMWRIVESRDLEPRWPAIFLEFILGDKGLFENFNRDFYGGGEEGLQRLLRRIDDPAFPPQKKWMYWLCVPSVAPNAEAAKTLLWKGIDSRDEFTRNAIGQYVKL